MLGDLILRHGDDLQIALFLGLFALLAGLERLTAGRAAPHARGARRRTNLGLTLLNLVVVSFLPLSFVSVAVWAEGRRFGLLNALTARPGLLVAATLLVRAFLSFGTHFLMHKVPSLWRVHRVHHLDTELDVTSTVRFHPLEMVLGLAIGAPVVALLGPVPWALALYELLDVVVTLFSHADLRLSPRLDRFLRLLIVTPSLHRIHHSTDPRETDTNFGAVFPLWDLALGTYRSGPEPARLGLDEARGPESQRVGWLLASPFRA